MKIKVTLELKPVKFAQVNHNSSSKYNGYLQAIDLLMK